MVEQHPGKVSYSNQHGNISDKNPQQRSPKSKNEWHGTKKIDSTEPTVCQDKKSVQRKDIQKENKKIYIHAEKQVRIVFAVNRNKTVLPLQSCDASRKTVLHIPENTSPKIDWKRTEKSITNLKFDQAR